MTTENLYALGVIFVSSLALTIIGLKAWVNVYGLRIDGLIALIGICGIAYCGLAAAGVVGLPR